MSQKIFSENGMSLLSEKMGICLEDLNQKIISDASSNIIFFRELVDFILTLTIPFKYGELGHVNNEKNQKYLDEKLFNFFEKYHFEDDSSEYIIFDNIRHAFINYCKGGIIEVYKYREAEVWYPKVIIKSNLGDKKAISSLNDEVIIYRGTSKDEYELGEFGQSWTLDEEVARNFAFVYYCNQDSYKNTIRVILKAKILKTNIYYHQKDDREKEVIVNSNQIILDSLQILDEQTL